MVRAKFKCTEKKQTTDGFVVSFQPVTHGSQENDEFFKWTPFGKLEMGILNVQAVEQFEVGKEYYLDFAPAN
jgi:hypothetical protein